MADRRATPPGAESLFRERWQVVLDEIRRRILSGELRPGQPLKEVEVADALGVSRGPVREAIRALEVSGLVSRRPQRTSIVTPITQREMDEVYSLRQVIEDFAIARSIELHLPQLGPDIESRLAALARAVSSGADVFVVADLDIQLHSAFYEWSDHNRLNLMWATLRDPLRLMMLFTNSVTRGSLYDGDHRAIVAAAAAGDIALAQRHSREHLERARSHMSAFVGAQSPS